MSRAKYLSEEQWKAIGPLLPRLNSKGRPWKENREVLEGILWVLRNGARWKDLPKEYPSPQYMLETIKGLGRAGSLGEDMAAFYPEVG